MYSYNKDWEDLQRDCTDFPAYTDYIFGIDTRDQVAQEPGLHPQIYPSPAPAGYEIREAMPDSQPALSAPDVTSSDQGGAAPGTDLGIPFPSTPPVAPRSSETRQQSITSASSPAVPVANNWSATSVSLSSPIQQVLDSALSSPSSTMAPFNLQQAQASPVSPASTSASASAPPIRLKGNTSYSTRTRFLRPGEILDSNLFGFVTFEWRRNVNESIIRYWEDCTIGLWNDEKAESMRRLREISNMVFSSQEEFFRRPMQLQLQQRQQIWQQDQNRHLVAQTQSHQLHRLASQPQTQHVGTAQPSDGMPKTRSLESAVRAYINHHLSGIRDAISMAMMHDPNMTPEALAKQQRARLWLSKLKASIPPSGHPILQQVVSQVRAEISQRRDSANSGATGTPVKLSDEHAIPASDNYPDVQG